MQASTFGHISFIFHSDTDEEDKDTAWRRCDIECVGADVTQVLSVSGCQQRLSAHNHLGISQHM